MIDKTSKLKLFHQMYEVLYRIDFVDEGTGDIPDVLKKVDLNAMSNTLGNFNTACYGIPDVMIGNLGLNLVKEIQECYQQRYN